MQCVRSQDLSESKEQTAPTIASSAHCQCNTEASTAASAQPASEQLRGSCSPDLHVAESSQHANCHTETRQQADLRAVPWAASGIAFCSTGTSLILLVTCATCIVMKLPSVSIWNPLLMALQNILKAVPHSNSDTLHRLAYCDAMSALMHAVQPVAPQPRY